MSLAVYRTYTIDAPVPADTDLDAVARIGANLTKAAIRMIAQNPEWTFVPGTASVHVNTDGRITTIQAAVEYRVRVPSLSYTRT